MCFSSLVIVDCCSWTFLSHLSTKELQVLHVVLCHLCFILTKVLCDSLGSEEGVWPRFTLWTLWLNGNLNLSLMYPGQTSESLEPHWLVCRRVHEQGLIAFWNSYINLYFYFLDYCNGLSRIWNGKGMYTWFGGMYACMHGLGVCMQPLANMLLKQFSIWLQIMYFHIMCFFQKLQN